MVDGVTQDPMDGVSMKYAFESADAPGRKRTQYFEIMGSRAIYHHGWMASAFGPRIPWVSGIDPAIFQWRPDQEPWELYNLQADFTQAANLADQQPDKLQAMIDVFLKEAEANKVFPIGGGLWTALRPEFIKQNPATEFHYTADVMEVPEATAPKLGLKSSLVTIDAEIDGQTEGVLYALGCFSGGIAAWIDDGKIYYEYNLYHLDRNRVITEAELPTGRVKIEVQSRFEPGVRNGPAEVAIQVNGRQFAEGRIPRTTGYGLSGNDTFDVGRDSFSPVSPLYLERAPFEFTGTIHKLTVKYLDAKDEQD